MKWLKLKSFAIANKNSDFSDFHCWLYTYQYTISIMDFRLHAISGNTHDIIGFPCYLVIDYRDIFRFFIVCGLSQSGGCWLYRLR